VTQFISILQFALPVVIAIATLEGLFLAVVMRKNYNWRAYFASLADALGREYVVLTFLSASLAAPAISLAWHNRLFTVPLDTATAVVVLVIGQDFCYYWFHRASHRIRWFWATHAVHHSSNELNLAASYRFGWTGRLAGAGVFYVPLIWLGFAPGPVFIASAFGLLYQFWIHAEWIPKLAGSNTCSTRARIIACITPPIRNISTAIMAASSSCSIACSGPSSASATTSPAATAW
jgi:sterol desaturase/sphingolipid hydroxylase (fatty acid hydroxylase superfamily)